MSEEESRIPNRFNLLHLGGSLEARRNMELAQFEASRLKALMQRMKLADHLGAVFLQAEQMTGVRELRFAAFNELFPTFPFRIGCHTLRGLPLPYGDKKTPMDYWVHRDNQSVEPARFKKFNWVPFKIAYDQLVQQMANPADLRKIALVFPRKGFTDGMVIHNDESENYWHTGLCWVYKQADGSRLYVQPFTALIEAIYHQGRGWRPPGA